MAPQHVFATAHGLTSYLKYQKGFGRKTKRRRGPEPIRPL